MWNEYIGSACSAGVVAGRERDLSEWLKVGSRKAVKMLQ